jgi:hypothetical protein
VAIGGEFGWPPGIKQAVAPLEKRTYDLCHLQRYDPKNTVQLAG